MKTYKAFTATWCTPCSRLKPFLYKLAEEHEIEFIDIDESSDIAESVGIKSIPTIIVLEDNVEVERLINPSPLQLKNKFEE